MQYNDISCYIAFFFIIIYILIKLKILYEYKFLWC